MATLVHIHNPYIIINELTASDRKSESTEGLIWASHYNCKSFYQLNPLVMLSIEV